MINPDSSRLPVFLFVLLSSSPALAAGAVDTVAQEATQALAQTPGASVVVVAAPLVSDQPAPKGDDLALRIAALVAGKIGAGAKAHPQAAQLATARAIAGRASALVFVQSEIARGDLRTTVDVYPSMANAWDRIRNPLPAPASHAFASVKIDAEVRTFLAPLVLEQASVHRAKHDEGDVLAAACGDVDADGGNELVLVSRARVAMGRIRAAKFVPERTAPWSALAPRAPVPVREPMASAVIARGAVHVGSTDRAGVSLTPDFVGHTALLGMPAWGGEDLVCLVPDPGAGGFAGAPFDCKETRVARGAANPAGPRFDAFAGASIRDAKGETRTLVVQRETGGKLKLRAGDAAPVSPEGWFGAQIAVADLDEDGAPDIATSTDAADDAITVWTWPAAGGELRPRFKVAAPGGVRALAACPPEDGGEPALVAVVANEVWIVRAGVVGAAASTGESPAEKR